MGHSFRPWVDVVQAHFIFTDKFHFWRRLPSERTGWIYHPLPFCSVNVVRCPTDFRILNHCFPFSTIVLFSCDFCGFPSWKCTPKSRNDAPFECSVIFAPQIHCIAVSSVTVSSCLFSGVVFTENKMKRYFRNEAGIYLFASSIFTQTRAIRKRN